MTESERRRADRRHDPNAWSADHRRAVKTIYGLAVGGVLTLAGVVVIVWAVLNERVEVATLGVASALVLLGLVASMPGTFMPVLSAVLKKIPWGRNGEAGGPATRALPYIADDDPDE